MPELFGYATFPGINQVVSATYTRGHGITPGVCTIECAPQADPISEAGDLTFFFGQVELIFPDCKADAGTARRNNDGLIWSIAILDRRWKWAFGTPIRGEYNRLDAGGHIIESTGNGSLPSSKKTATELADLCFAAMGENGDASQLPGNAFPYVLWEDDNPAAALADLAETLGFRVVLQLDDISRLLPVGQGADLPDLQTVMENSLALDSPEPPDKIRVTGAPTVLQARLLLQAVGRDVDGTIVPIDNLTYTPKNGWDAETNLFGSITDDTQRKNALQSVFRWYQILIDGGSNSLSSPSGSIVATDLSQILPVHASLVQTYIDDNIKKPLPANIWGVFWIGNIGTPLNSNQSRTVSGNTFTDSTSQAPAISFPFRGNFQVLEERGIVQFDSPMRVWDSGASLFRRCTQLYLECSFSMRSPDTWELLRYSYDFPFPGETFGAGVEVVKRPNDLQLKAYQAFDGYGNNTGWVKTVSNDDLDPEALEYAKAAAAKYQQPDTQDATYAGLIDIDLDGAIQQVTLTVGPAGATTRASRNTETHPWFPPYNTRRQKEKSRSIQRQLDPLIADARRTFSVVTQFGRGIGTNQ